LIIFGGNNFIIPAMIMILLILTILKKPIENVEEVSV
ncbi:branched-chain amino acid transporter AzlC, partial [Bacillus sp. D-CC]